MTYIQCPNCGQKALEVASRCPRCGTAFEEQFSQRRVATPKPRRRPWGLIVVLAVGVGLWAVASRLEQPSRGVAARPSAPRDSAGATEPAPVRISAVATPDSVPRDSAPAIQTKHDTIPPAGPAAPPVPAARAAPADSSPSVTRYTTTWVNVRSGRNNRSAVVGILRPRILVRVGSPDRGWYRVLDRPEAQGFVDGRFLVENLPAQR